RTCPGCGATVAVEARFCSASVSVACDGAPGAPRRWSNVFGWGFSNAFAPLTKARTGVDASIATPTGQNLRCDVAQGTVAANVTLSAPVTVAAKLLVRFSAARTMTGAYAFVGAQHLDVARVAESGAAKEMQHA